jgi:hypothetical protein
MGDAGRRGSAAKLPTNRTRRTRKPQPDAISPDAIASWQSGDYWALHHALGMRPWQMPDWNCDPPEEPWKVQPLPQRPRAPDPEAIKAALIEIAGPPPRRWRYRRADQ